MMQRSLPGGICCVQRAPVVQKELEQRYGPNSCCSVQGKLPTSILHANRCLMLYELPRNVEAVFGDAKVKCSLKLLGIPTPVARIRHLHLSVESFMRLVSSAVAPGQAQAYFLR